MPPDTAPGSDSQSPKWTVMVFMGAATIQGNEPLIAAAEADLAEMAFVGSGTARDGDNGTVRGELNIFVQVHQGKDVVPRRAHVMENMRPEIEALDPVPRRMSMLPAVRVYWPSVDRRLTTRRFSPPSEVGQARWASRRRRRMRSFAQPGQLVRPSKA
jgi:hypothetical protein